MKYLMSLAVVVFLAALPQCVSAQQEKDPFADSFFDPGLVMENLKEIGLSSESREILIEEITEAQKTFTLKQFDLQDKMAELLELTKKPKVDEKAVLAQLEEVLNIERQIKVAQLMLMVKVKNQLSEEQQKMLREIEKRKGK